MRGSISSLGEGFRTFHEPKSKWIIDKIFLSAHPVPLQEGGAYDFWNIREIPPGHVKRETIPIRVPQSAPFPHIVSRGLGGWGQVPETDVNIVKAEQAREELRRGVKQKC